MQNGSKPTGPDRMIFRPVPTGGRNNVAYLVADAGTRDAVVVDAGYQSERILTLVAELDLKLNYVLATHRHNDHIGAAAAISAATGAAIAAFRTVPGIDVKLKNGDCLMIGCVRIDVLHTPGHTSDSICFLVDESKLLAGDTLFVGRAPRSSPDTRTQMRCFFDTLHNIVMQLDDKVEVWPGHDVGPRPSSTIGEQRRDNYVLQMDFNSFWQRRWTGEKWIIPGTR